jgi:hypothetical protein
MPTSSSGPPPTRTRRPRRPSCASRPLSHHTRTPHPASALHVVPATSARPTRRLPQPTGPARNPYPSTTRTPTPPPATPRTPTPFRLLLGFCVRVRLRVGPRGARVRGQLYRATPVRSSCQLGYNIHTRRKICLLARLQACRPDRRQLTLRRLPRLTSLPGGNTTRSSWGEHSHRGSIQRLQPWLSRSTSLHDYRDARNLRHSP